MNYPHFLFGFYKTIPTEYNKHITKIRHVFYIRNVWNVLSDADFRTLMLSYE